MIRQVHYVENWSSSGSPEQRDDEAALFAEREGADEIWYWYSSGQYEGSGCAILRGEDGRWGVADLGHCSCYDPLYDGSGHHGGGHVDVTWHATLADLKAHEADTDAAPLLAVIGDRP